VKILLDNMGKMGYYGNDRVWGESIDSTAGRPESRVGRMSGDAARTQRRKPWWKRRWQRAATLRAGDDKSNSNDPKQQDKFSVTEENK